METALPQCPNKISPIKTCVFCLDDGCVVDWKLHKYPLINWETEYILTEN